MKAITPLQLRTLPFEEAAKYWLEIKKLYSKKPRTIEMYEWYIRNLEKSLPACCLHRYTLGILWSISGRGAFQRERHASITN